MLNKNVLLHDVTVFIDRCGITVTARTGVKIVTTLIWWREEGAAYGMMNLRY